MASRLETCPFCSSHRLHIHQHMLSYSVACETCKSRGPSHKTIEAALQDWNLASQQVRWTQPLKADLDDIKDVVEHLNAVLRHYKADIPTSTRKIPAVEH